MRLETYFLSPKHGMEYFMHHPHEPIMYSRNNIYKTEEIPHQCYFTAEDSEINKNKEYSKFFHKYCDADHAIDIAGRRSVKSIVHLLNVNLADICAKKQYETSRISPNEETRSIYTGVLDQNWIRNFFRSIYYPIGPPLKLCEENQATIKILLADRITPQARTINILITALREIYLRKTFDMVGTRSNM